MLKRIFCLVIVCLLLLFAAFFSIAVYFKNPEVDEALYEHPQKSCYESSLCIESQGYYYEKISSEWDPNKALEDFTAYMKNINAANTDLKFRYQNGVPIAEAQEDIAIGRNIFSFDKNNCLGTTSVNPSFFKSSMNADKLIKDMNSLKKFETQTGNDLLLLSFMYHILNIEHSTFAPWLRILPRKISSLLARLTLYEYGLLKDDKSYSNVGHYTKVMKDEFRHLQSRIKKYLSEEERRSLFNNYELKISDYHFARDVFENYGLRWNTGLALLVPGNGNILKLNKEDGFEHFTTRRMEKGEDAEDHILIVSDRNHKVSVPSISVFFKS